LSHPSLKQQPVTGSLGQFPPLCAHRLTLSQFTRLTFQSSGQFAAEQDVGQFALTIGFDRTVGIVKIYIVEIYASTCKIDKNYAPKLSPLDPSSINLSVLKQNRRKYQFCKSIYKDFPNTLFAGKEHVCDVP
jgi:hypothetical protein